MGKINTAGLLRSAALLSVSYAALACVAAHAQTAGATQQAQVGSQLPEIQITAPEVKRRAASAPAQRANRTAGARRRAQVARQPQPQAAPAAAFGLSQD